MTKTAEPDRVYYPRQIRRLSIMCVIFYSAREKGAVLPYLTVPCRAVPCRAVPCRAVSSVGLVCMAVKPLSGGFRRIRPANQHKILRCLQEYPCILASFLLFVKIC